MKAKSDLVEGLLSEHFRFPEVSSKVSDTVQSILEWERVEDKKLLSAANKEIRVILKKLSESQDKVEMLAECVKEESEDKRKVEKEMEEVKKEMLSLRKLQDKTAA